MLEGGVVLSATTRLGLAEGWADRTEPDPDIEGEQLAVALFFDLRFAEEQAQCVRYCEYLAEERRRPLERPER